jgi:BMFP domain-containing protein YqiC
MAKTPTGELFATLKGYLNQLSDGDRTPNEVASALNGWARESAESIKAKVAEEVDAQVSKMGFIKRAEYEKLVARVEKLENSRAKKSPAKKAAAKKAPTTAKIVKKSAAKKVTAKKASK